MLGTLSVLRTSAASTGSTALRALVGTAAGFFIGAGLILAIGDNTQRLWAALPIAVLVAAYSPGTAPFAVGQAAFTVTVSVLYNILVPVGWQVGVVRVEDVAIGAAVSAVVGVLFWPRGAGCRSGRRPGRRLPRRWPLPGPGHGLGGRQPGRRPDAARRAANAAVRLDEALRGLMAEQGTKRVPKEHVWRLVGGTMRLRLTAQSLSVLTATGGLADPARQGLVAEAARLAGLVRRGRRSTRPRPGDRGQGTRQLARGRQWGVGLDARLSALGPPPPRSLAPLSGRTGRADRRGRRPPHGSVVALISTHTRLAAALRRPNLPGLTRRAPPPQPRQ